jgi:hypothetical protein
LRKEISQEEEEEEIKKEIKYAQIDDMAMDNFDLLLPEENRAIVYPFDLDLF